MSEIVFDEATTLWISENDEVLHVATPTDNELEEQEWAQFVSVHEAQTQLEAKDQRIEQLEKVLVNAKACLNAVIGSKEQWTLEQERIGNKAICLISIKEIEQALSQKGGKDE